MSTTSIRTRAPLASFTLRGSTRHIVARRDDDHVQLLDVPADEHGAEFLIDPDLTVLTELEWRAIAEEYIRHSQQIGCSPIPRPHIAAPVRQAGPAPRVAVTPATLRFAA
jgi:hypothetical protein